MNSLKKAGKSNEIFSKLNKFLKESKTKEDKHLMEMNEHVQDLKIDTETILKIETEGTLEMKI